MSTLLIIIPIITLALGFVAGVAACKTAAHSKIEQIKTDAKTSIKETAQDSFQAGYMRAYSDKTLRQAQMLADKIANGSISIPA